MPDEEKEKEEKKLPKEFSTESDPREKQEFQHEDIKERRKRRHESDGA